LLRKKGCRGHFGTARGTVVEHLLSPTPLFRQMLDMYPTDPGADLKRMDYSGAGTY
jgi:hypothetical protein